MKTLKLLTILLCCWHFSTAQTTKKDILTNEADRLFREGYYEEAINTYLDLKKISEQHSSLFHQLALCYFYIEDYKEAIHYSDQIIKTNTQYLLEAYIIKAKAYDHLKKRKKAIELLEEAQNTFNDQYVILYNLGLLYFEENAYQDAERVLLAALKVNPSYTHIHFLLGKTQAALKQTSTALLSYYFYSLLAPTSSESKEVLTHIKGVLSGKIKIEIANTDDLILNANTKIEFAGADLALQAKSLTKYENLSVNDILISHTDFFFKTLGDIRKGNQGIWWTLYVDFFSRLANEGHTEAFWHYIHQTYSDESSDWVRIEFKKVQEMVKWINTYQERFNSSYPSEQ